MERIDTTPEPSVLTVIAQAANGDFSLPNGNVFLHEVFDRLDKVAARPQATSWVKGVNSVNEIQDAIEGLAAGSASIVLQIIGHGRPGELDLGRSWTHIAQDLYRSYMIENNSRELAMLSIGRGCVSEVRLVACDVGAEDGFPLMFTLSHILDCDVSAATVDVRVEMFNSESGLYEGEMMRCERVSRAFSRVPGAARTDSPRRLGTLAALTPLQGKVREITFQRLRFVRTVSLIPEQSVFVEVSEEESRRIWAGCHAVAQASDGPSVVEYAFDGTIATDDGKMDCGLEILSNRTCRLIGLESVDLDGPRRWGVDAVLRGEALSAIAARYARAWRAMGQRVGPRSSFVAT
jgi:hypothetical protein